MIVDEGLELLDDAQCLGLLASAEIGRVGVSIAALPAIFPVNFRLIDGAIVFRTSPGTKLEAAATEAVLAFEADDFAVADRSGWSVLAVGRSHVVTDPAVREQARQAGLEPFADGPRHTLVAIDVEVLSGRRLVHSPPPGGPGWAFAG